MKKKVKMIYLILVALLIGSCVVYSYTAEQRNNAEIEKLMSKPVTLEIIEIEKKSRVNKNHKEEDLKLLDEDDISYSTIVKKYREEGESLLLINGKDLYDLVESGKLELGSKVTVEDRYLIKNNEVIYTELGSSTVYEAFLKSIK